MNNASDTVVPPYRELQPKARVALCIDHIQIEAAARVFFSLAKRCESTLSWHPKISGLFQTYTHSATVTW